MSPNKAMKLTSPEPIGGLQLIAGVRRTGPADLPGIADVHIIGAVSGSEELGWSALPRVVVWLCIPALLTGMSGATIMLAGALLSTEAPACRVIQQAAAAEGVVFTLPGVALTPVAAIVTFVITRRKTWATRVVRTLWAVVAVSTIVLVPAANSALAHYVYSTPRPAEAPPVSK